MSDAPRRDHATSEREEPPPAVPADEAEQPDPDALGAWPAGEEEARSMPAEQQHAPQGGDEAATPHDETAAEPGGGEQPDAAPDAAQEPRTREEALAALAEVQRERDEYLEGMRRARAEFENYRKRTMREGASQRESGKAELADGLLEVLDDLDRTLEAAEASPDESLARGVQLVAEKLVGTLRSSGLERVDATGVLFDPNLHEAVQQAAADEPRDEPVVAQVLRPGYVLGERVLRAAMVVVEQ